MPAYYPFAEQAAALLAVKLTSSGQISIYSLKRPAEGAAMTPRFATTTLAVTNPAGLKFKFEVNPANVGLFTFEPDGWPVPYETNIIHFLGQFNPYGLNDIIYQAPRPQSVQANRIMNCTFMPNGNLTIEDGVGGSSGTFRISNLDGSVAGSGCAWAAVRVTGANFAAGCATLSFPGGETFSSLPGSMQTVSNQSVFVLQP
jgi:hypothetical protein